MTTGHTHRMLTVKRDGIVQRVLTKPLVRRRNLERVEASPYPYGVLVDGERISDRDLGAPSPREVYYLSALSILHRWIGLTLQVED